MSLLIYSDKCQHSREVIQFIKSNAKLQALPFAYHDIHRSPLPPQLQKRVTRVPTMVTKDGKLLLGAEIKNWLRSLLPNEEVQHFAIGIGRGSPTSALDGNDNEGDLFSLDSFGVSLQPAMTPEIERKINAEVTQVAYSDLQG